MPSNVPIGRDVRRRAFFWYNYEDAERRAGGSVAQDEPRGAGIRGTPVLNLLEIRDE